MSPAGGAPPRRRWVLACTLAEAVGMTAAATAARSTDALTDGEGAGAGARWVALAWLVVVLAGLVEGLALGLLQSRALHGCAAASLRRRWLGVTVLVAGLGWAAASAPSVLAGDTGGGSEPPLALVLGGAAGLGLAMGALLGAAQALAVRGAMRRPWQWVRGSTLGWAAAMVVIFAGATTPSADTPTLLVVPLGTVTGAAAGALLGLITHPALVRATGQLAPHTTPAPTDL